MDPLSLMMGARTLVDVLGGVSNAVRGGARAAGNTAADVQGQHLTATAAADPMSFSGQFADQSFANFNPDSRMGQAVEAASVRNMGRNYNLNQKTMNEALKRSYVADTYKNMQGLGMNAINSYLQNAQQQTGIMGQLAATRF